MVLEEIDWKFSEKGVSFRRVLSIDLTRKWILKRLVPLRFDVSTAFKFDGEGGGGATKLGRLL